MPKSDTTCSVRFDNVFIKINNFHMIRSQELKIAVSFKLAKHMFNILSMQLIENLGHLLVMRKTHIIRKPSHGFISFPLADQSFVL